MSKYSSTIILTAEEAFMGFKSGSIEVDVEFNIEDNSITDFTIVHMNIFGIDCFCTNMYKQFAGIIKEQYCSKVYANAERKSNRKAA